MLARPEHLPDFDSPPVSEVFFVVYFAPLRGLRQAHLGAFWNTVRDELPRVEDQPGSEYPRYEALRDKFVSRWERFTQTMTEAGVTPKIVNAEVCYTNQVSVEQLADLITLVAPATPLAAARNSTPRVEHYVARSQIAGDDGAPIAGLVLEATSTTPMGYIMSLLVRGPVPTSSFEDAMKLIDMGRELIVGTFDEVTTPERHKEWKRK